MEVGLNLVKLESIKGIMKGMVLGNRWIVLGWVVWDRW